MTHPLYDDADLILIAGLLARDVRGTPNAKKWNSDRFDLAMSVLFLIAKDRNWHYLMLLAITDAHRNPSLTIRKTFDEHIDIGLVIKALVYGHRINDALNLELGDEVAMERFMVTPMKLPARRWNFIKSDQWVDAQTIRQLLVSIHTASLLIPEKYRRALIIHTLIKRCGALNKCMIEGALAQLVRHSRTISALRWSRLTTESRSKCIHVRLHYSFRYLTITMMIGRTSAQKRKLLGKEMRRLISDDERATMDDYFGPQVLGNFVYGALSQIRDCAELSIIQAKFQILYNLLLRDLLEQPSISQEIEKLGQYPTLVITTHGALAQLPFGVLYDGANYLAEQFNIVQASILFSRKDFQKGKIDPQAMTGGDPIAKPRVRVLLNTEKLDHTIHELDHYDNLNENYGASIDIYPAEKSHQWNAQTVRWLMEDSGIGVLSTHMRSSAQRASDAALATPDGREIPFSDVMDRPFNADLLVLAGCVSMSPTDWLAPGESNLVSLCLQNGVKATITTLWPVDDFAARRYNELLISAINDGMPRAVAHGMAQRGVMQSMDTNQLASQERIVHQRKRHNQMPITPIPLKLDHPYYWGGFILSGAWR